MSNRASRDRRWLLRAGSGVALLLAGLVVVSVGGAGLLADLFRGLGATPGTAQTAAFGLAGLAPPVVLFFATRSVTKDPTPRQIAGGGATLAGASAVAAGIGGGVAGLASGSPLAILLAVAYAMGTVLAFAGLLGGVATGETSRRSNAAGVSWEASDRADPRSRSGVAPADGGSTDSELSFPLDSDREDAAEDERN